MGPGQYQHNFDERAGPCAALLPSLIAALRLPLPEEIKGVYGPGDQYGFYRDLSSLVATVSQGIFIIDPYLGEEMFNLYVAKVPDTAPVRILSGRMSPNAGTAAKMYASNRPLELRSSAAGHGRAVFLDQRGWVIGQPIKGALPQ